VKSKTSFVNNIAPGDTVEDTFLVSEKYMAVSQKGHPYVNLRLRDRTGEIEARIWDNAEAMGALFRKGDIVRVRGRALSYKDSLQLSLSEVGRTVDGECHPADYYPASKENTAEMFAALRDCIGTVTNPYLRELLNAVFDDKDIADSFCLAPAAKGFHHSYVGGLLTHTLSTTQLLSRMADHYPQADRDLLIAGGILHDIGKIAELSFKKMFDYTDEGRLIGHIVLGVEMIDKKIAAIENFPATLAMELRHILLSHHGTLEYGSPKRPKTLEALIVYYADDLDAKVNAYREFMDESDGETNWTPYHRLLDRFLYRKK
jgi:3'-5' exoribonuclease